MLHILCLIDLILPLGMFLTVEEKVNTISVFTETPVLIVTSTLKGDRRYKCCLNVSQASPAQTQ